MMHVHRDGASEAATGWSLVVPLKPLSRAKSRLAAATSDDLRPGLALAFAQDTVRAVLACPAVRDVVVVTDDPLAADELTALGALVVPDTPGKGLNAALAHGAATVRARRPEAPVAALNADLPALRPMELHRVLTAASEFRRAFLADAAGIGTTFLAAAPQWELDPAFGGPSRARHRATGAHDISLPDVPSVRQDVDTGPDLRAAVLMGVGPHTAALLGIDDTPPPAPSAPAGSPLPPG
ncbi:2-phospho-L-lactate guanylyltransferase [Streptomyces sp. HSW2009]|uniref:2-phospho-L-lactate guanylyltransferase n=1 Tax=Streptomyces sp. HSW2009 TaxID=3142890 RepID=UPI0032EF5E7B